MEREEITSIEELAVLLHAQDLIGVDGCDGAGKSHLSAKLASILGAEIISIDDFKEKRRDCYVEAIQFEEVKDRLAKSPRPVIVEGVCLQAVLKRLGVTTNETVYVKLYSRHGEWTNSDECDTSTPVEDVLCQLRSEVNRISAAIGDTPSGLSGIREEIIRYHHQYLPWEEGLIFRRAEVD